MKRVAVLMTVHNRKDTTLRCLQLLYEQQYDTSQYSVDVFLTNDGCTDGTDDAVRNQFPDVHIIQGDGTLYWNRGMIAAWNVAAQYDYDYYVWLNDDTLLYHQALVGIVEASVETKERAIIVGATQSEITGVCTYGLQKKRQKLIPNGEFQKGVLMNGNFVIVPRRIYKDIGMLDSYYRHASADNDYGLTAIEHGYSLLLAKEYVGICEYNAVADMWCDPQNSFFKRINELLAPTGQPLNEVFHYDYVHKGIFVAIFHCVTTFSRCCFPRLWVGVNKNVR